MLFLWVVLSQLLYPTTNLVQLFRHWKMHVIVMKNHILLTVKSAFQEQNWIRFCIDSILLIQSRLIFNKQQKLNRNVFIEMCQSSRSDRLKFQMHLNCTCHCWLTGEQLQHMSTDMPLILCIEFKRLSLQWNTSLKCYLVNCFGVFGGSRIWIYYNVVEWYHQKV